MRTQILAILFISLLAGSSPAADALRILTYNIHHGQGTDGKFDLERIAKLILAEKPDLVAIQEVDVKTGRAGGVDQAAELARLTGMHGRFGKFMDYSGGEYGQMVLSRFPIKSVTNFPLPKGAEPRTALAVRVEIKKGTDLTFVGNHLSGTDSERLAQAKELIRLFSEDAAHTILAGDFNCEPHEPAIQLLQKHWLNPDADKVVPTWSAETPKIEIDYVFLPKEFKSTNYYVIDEKLASDHRPLACWLQLAE